MRWSISRRWNRGDERAKANAATLLAATDQARLWAMTQALVQAVLSRDAPKEGAPAVRPVITDALTPKGEISLIGENAPPRVIRLLFHWGMDGTPVLRRLSAAVQAAGYSVEEHLCPLVPGRLLHLTIPALATLVTTGEQLSAEQQQVQTDPYQPAQAAVGQPHRRISGIFPVPDKPTRQ